MPEIGCGSRAKPILMELERDSGIEEAWLSRSGTQLAVRWSDNIPLRAKKEALQTVLKRHDLSATELRRSERARALKAFQSGTGWHRADAVDRLSEEESGIIAARLVRRVQGKTPLTESKAATLKESLRATLVERFTGSPERAARSLEEERDDLLKKAAGYLNEKELAALKDAFASGVRPLPGEE